MNNEKKKMAKKIVMDKKTSGYFIGAFTTMCLLITMFLVTDGLSKSYADGVEYTRDTIPQKLTICHKGNPAGCPANAGVFDGGAAWSFATGLNLQYNFYGVDESGNAHNLYCIEGKQDLGIAIDGEGNVQRADEYTNPTKMDASKSVGLAYILNNAYPINNNSTYMSGLNNDNEKKYVTQYAIWYYLSLLGDTNQLEDSYKTTIEAQGDVYTKVIYELANKAVDVNSKGEGKVTVDVSNLSFSQDGDYVVSSEIKPEITNPELLNYVTVSLGDNDYDAKLVSDGGEGNEIRIGADSSFKVRLPIAKIQNTKDPQINLSLTAKFSDEVYEYQSKDSAQRPIIAIPGTRAVPVTLTIPFTPTEDTASYIPSYVYIIGLMVIIIGGVVMFEAVKPKKK